MTSLDAEAAMYAAVLALLAQREAPTAGDIDSLDAAMKALHDQLYAEGREGDALIVERAAYAIEALEVDRVLRAAPQEAREPEAESLVAALRAIIDMEPEPYAFPDDWQAQIAACEECKRWKNHPIQQGICDTHRQPLWDRDAHVRSEQIRLHDRMRSIAREALDAYVLAPAPAEATEASDALRSAIEAMGDLHRALLHMGRGRLRAAEATERSES